MSGPLFTKPSKRVLLFWLVLAAVNLSAGVFISSQPDRVTDLENMMRWGHGWLAEEQNVYEVDGWAVAYPPNGVVALSPLGLLPFSIAHPFWVLLNIALAILAPYLSARFFRPHDPLRVIVLPILMFLSWGGVRTLGQFTLITLVLSMAAMLLADRRRVMSGLCLGLALTKPQVAVPVFLWNVFTRRWTQALTALAVAGSLFAVFCVWVDANPIRVSERYLEILAAYHTGDAILSGASELRPLIRQLVTETPDVDTIAGSIALGLITAICVAGFQEGGVRKKVLYAAPPLVACWSLLTLYHLTYGFVILLPVMMLLALNDAPRSRLRLALFWVLQLGMMFDIPGLSRRAGLLETALYTHVLAHADRALMVTLFVGLAALAWREPPEESAVGSR